MDAPKKKYLYISICILLVVLFVFGWFWGKFNPRLTNPLPASGTDNSAVKPTATVGAGYSLTEQKNIVNSSQSLVQKLLQGSPANPALLLNCTATSCTTADQQTPPFQWIQYANAYYNIYIDSGYDLSAILADLNTYPLKDFNWKLYQYGDLLTIKANSYPALAKRYLEITDAFMQFNDQPAAAFKFYTTEDPANKDFLTGSSLGNYNQLSINVIDYSTKVNTLADAYILSANEKYKIKAENLLNFIHGATYFDQAINNQYPDFKMTTCNTLLADVYAYKAFKDPVYLGYFNYLESKASFKDLFGSDQSAVAATAKDPMRILPCLDALQQLSKLNPDKSAVYNQNYDYLIGFMKKNNIVINDQADPYYGFVKLSSGTYDVNSSAWLIKIMAAKLNTN